MYLSDNRINWDASFCSTIKNFNLKIIILLTTGKAEQYDEKKEYIKNFIFHDHCEISMSHNRNKYLTKEKEYLTFGPYLAKKN